MSEPKKQHLVPRCYLKNFGLKHGEKLWRVDAFNKKHKNFIDASVADICAQIDYYTIPSLPDSQKRYIEKFYSEYIEKNYTPIYHLLIEEKPKYLSTEHQLNLINFVISQHIRTDKYLKQFNKFWDSILESEYSLIDFKTGHTSLTIAGQKIDFNNKTLDEVKKDFNKTNKDIYNQNTIEWIFRLSQIRLFDKISVQKLHPSVKLITCDNPVQFSTGLYSENSFVRMPLDQDHILVLSPSKRLEDLKLIDKRAISYTTLSEEDSWMLGNFNNLSQIENAEMFLIGKKKHIEDCLTFHGKWGEAGFEKKCTEILDKQKATAALLEKLSAGVGL